MAAFDHNVNVMIKTWTYVEKSLTLADTEADTEILFADIKITFLAALLERSKGCNAIKAQGRF